MAEPCDRFAEIESLVASAGQYVQPSDDLRPRTLEAARTARAEQRGQQWVRHAAIAAAVVGLAISLRGTTETKPQLNDSDAMYRQATLRASGVGGLGWGLVQAFTELREEQAEKLRSAD